MAALVAGPALAGLGIGALAVRAQLRLALLCVLVSSIGVAGFHPEASKFAAWLSGSRRSTAMSVFSVGGNLGVALGPLLGGVIASQYGLGGVWLLAIPASPWPASNWPDSLRSAVPRRTRASPPRAPGATAGTR